jgi:hypothetical protein
MSTTQIPTTNVIIGEFNTYLGKIQIYQNNINGSIKHFKEEDGKFKLFKDFNNHFEYNQKPYLDLYDIKNEEIVNNLLAPNEFNLNHNDDLTIDSYRNQNDSLNKKYSLDNSTESVAETETSIESFTKTETESIDKTIDINSYSKIVKNNLPQTKVEENKIDKKICSLKLTKNDIQIDKLCQIFIDHINNNLGKYKYYISKDIHSIVYCLTGMEDIKNQLKLEFENNNYWVDNIKKTRFITSINDQLEKEKLKISVGPSLNNDKWTIVILHHIDNTKPSFKNINKNKNN